jgi:cell division protein FtsL
MATATRAVRAPVRTEALDEVVREPRRRLQVVARRRRRLWLATVVAAMVFAIMASLITVQLRGAAAQRELDRIRFERVAVLARNDRLKLIIDQMKAPELIVSQATAQGLQPPTDRVRLVPQPAQLAEATAGPTGTTNPADANTSPAAPHNRAASPGVDENAGPSIPAAGPTPAPAP